MQINPLEKILSVNCHLHPDTPSEILHATSDTTKHRACLKCVLKGNVPSLSVLDLKNLFSMDDHQDSILNYYPPMTDPSIFTRLDIIQKFSIDQGVQQVEQYISNLKKSFEEMIVRLKKDSMRSIDELEQKRRQVFDLYKSLCEAERLKEAVLESSQTQQEGKLHDIIVKKCKDAGSNEKKLLSVIREFEANQQKFSTKLANESAESIKNITKDIESLTSIIAPLIHSHSILQDFALIPSNLVDSASRILISKKENNLIEAKYIRDNGQACAVLSSKVLENDKHYIFRVGFHQQAEGSPCFRIGLVNQADKNESEGNYCGYSEDDYDCQINKIDKGNVLCSGPNGRNLHKEIEMRVHLASQTVKVADFPNYCNVVELADKTEIKKGKPYCLLMCINYLNNYMTINDVIITNQFDNQM